MLFLYVPGLVLVVLSFSSGDSALSLGGGLSTRWYAIVLADHNIIQALQNSRIVAVVATVAGTTIALLAALATSGLRFRDQSAIEVSVGLPLVVPDIVSEKDDTADEVIACTLQADDFKSRAAGIRGIAERHLRKSMRSPLTLYLVYAKEAEDDVREMGPQGARMLRLSALRPNGRQR